MNENNNINGLKLIALHLLPGIILTIVFIPLALAANHYGLPTLLSMYIAMSIGIIPVLLGYLFFIGKKYNKTFSLKGIIKYRQKIPIWQYFVFVPVIIAVAVGIFFAFSSIDSLILNKIFFWIPGWFKITQETSTASFSKMILVITFSLGIVINGILAPFAEELYFRGYLLPRMKSFGKWAPLINTSLFSLYHFFSPWQFFTRILAILPMAYSIWWKKNIYIGIIAHCFLNILTVVMLMINSGIFVKG